MAGTAITGDRTSESTLTALAIDPDDLSVFAARSGVPIDVWNGTTGRLITRLGDGSEVVRCVAATADYVVAGTAAGYLLVWRRRSWELLDRVLIHDGFRGVEALSVSPDGRRVATGGDDSIIRVWDTRRSDWPISLVGHQASIQALAFHPDGRRLVSGGADGTVRVWDAEHGDLLLTLRHDGAITGLAFSPDGTRVAASSATGRIFVWNTAPAETMKNQQGMPR